MDRKSLGKPLLKGARVRALKDQSGEPKGKKSNKMVDTTFVSENSGTNEKALRKAYDVNMLKADSGGKVQKFVTIIPRFKLRRGGKVYRMEFLLKRLRKIKMTMSEDYE